VLEQNEKHCSSEILRELGLMYLLNKQYQDASRELTVYIERRAYDPEGLYYYGQTLEGLGRPAEAKEMYARAVEAARATPRFRRRYTAKWSRLAQKRWKQALACAFKPQAEACSTEMRACPSGPSRVRKRPDRGGNLLGGLCLDKPNSTGASSNHVVSTFNGESNNETVIITSRPVRFQHSFVVCPISFGYHSRQR